MLCQKCKRSIPEENNYCLYCGTPVGIRYEFIDESQIANLRKSNRSTPPYPQKIITMLASKRPRPNPIHEEDAKEKIAKAIASRRGQWKFRQNLLKEYGSKCLITGANTEEILEAAHIQPYSAGGTFEISNDLLLRADIHTLIENLHDEDIDLSDIPEITAEQMAKAVMCVGGKPLPKVKLSGQHST